MSRDMKTWTLIRDLEEAVFKLKEHLLNVDASSSKTGQTDTDTVGKQPICCVIINFRHATSHQLSSVTGVHFVFIV